LIEQRGIDQTFPHYYHKQSIKQTMNDRSNDVVTQGCDASSKLPSEQLLLNNPGIAPVQRSGSWSWPKIHSKGRDSTSATASMDQDFAPAADQSLADGAGGSSAALVGYSSIRS
jgi:hypothetical protein